MIIIQSSLVVRPPVTTFGHSSKFTVQRGGHREACVAKLPLITFSLTDCVHEHRVELNLVFSRLLGSLRQTSFPKFSMLHRNVYLRLLTILTGNFAVLRLATQFNELVA